MIRERPPEEPRVWPRSNRSKPSTEVPRFARWYAAALPCAPRPATTTSAATNLSLSRLLARVLIRAGSLETHDQPDRPRPRGRVWLGLRRRGHDERTRGHRDPERDANNSPHDDRRGEHRGIGAGRPQPARRAPPRP